MNDKLIKDLKGDNSNPPILLLFSTYIPCDKTHSSDKTDCAEQLRRRVDGIRKPKSDGSITEPPEKIQLFVSFFEVYQKDVEGHMADFTNLDKAVNHLTSPDICLTYIVPKLIPDNGPIPTVSPDSRTDKLALSPCLKHAGWSTREYESLFYRNTGARPDQIAQVILYNHLVKFVSHCLNHINGQGTQGRGRKGRGRKGHSRKGHSRKGEGRNPENILAFAINYAFQGCIQKDEKGDYCGKLVGPLEGNIYRDGTNKQRLYKCLSDYWVENMGTYRVKGCRGSLKNIVETGVSTAIQAGVTVGYPSSFTHLENWKSLPGPWNIEIKDSYNTRFDNYIVQCPNREWPEYLCTSYPRLSSSSRSRSGSRSRQR